MPKISVIMGVYNCKSEELLRASVQSIIDQTYTDWEFLICNDGSSDDTLDKLYEAAKMDKRIKVLTYEKNRGLAGALNYCLEHALGEYIARQDDDDISYSRRFEKELKFLEEHPEIGFIGTGHDICDDNGIWGEEMLPEFPSKDSFLWNSPFSHPTIMIKKEILESVGGYRVAKETRSCEDFDLFMRLYANGYRGYNLQEKLYKYRVVNDPNKKYRSMEMRIEEAVVRYKGYEQMGILLRGIPFIIKPLLIGLIPQKLFYWIRKIQYR